MENYILSIKTDVANLYLAKKMMKYSTRYSKLRQWTSAVIIIAFKDHRIEEKSAETEKNL